MKGARHMAKGAEATKFFDQEEKPMSESDRTKVSAELAEIDQQIKAVKEEKRNVNSKYRVRINDLEKRQDVLSRQIIDGVVEVSFEVLEEHDDERLVVDIIRKDTEERISTRQMTEPEKEAARKRKQLKIPGTEDDGIIDDDAIPRAAVRGTAKGSKRKGGKK
jgi:hypothetical protein